MNHSAQRPDLDLLEAAISVGRLVQASPKIKEEIGRRLDRLDRIVSEMREEAAAKGVEDDYEYYAETEADRIAEEAKAEEHDGVCGCNGYEGPCWWPE